MVNTFFYYRDYWIQINSSLGYEDRPGNVFTWAIFDPISREKIIECDTEPDKTTRYAENVARSYVDHFLSDPKDWAIQEPPWKKAKF